MTAKQLFQSGQLTEAIQALNGELRNDPLDVQRRTFLFELLCFTGEYDRAEKQLNILSEQNQQSQMGAVLYYSALHAERLRQELFGKGEYPGAGAVNDAGATEDAPVRSGTLNGERFDSIEDADPRIGPRLELFAAGAYLWMPFEHIEAIEIEAPKRLRDTMWAPALVRTGPAFRGKELGEVLVPVISPHSWKSADNDIRLGRKTEWQDGSDVGQLPVGQKMLLVDGEEFPFLEIRSLEFDEATAEATAT